VQAGFLTSARHDRQTGRYQVMTGSSRMPVLIGQRI
jgi:hypothetical protein